MASSGAYGAEPYDKAALYAQALIHDIEAELPDAAYFTREDLLYLPCLMHVATITRYNYVCKAVRYAIDRKWLVEVGRNGLILSGRKSIYNKASTSWEAYIDTVTKLLPPRGTTFTVPSVLQKWTTDHHLTEGTKRTYVRQVFRRMKSMGTIEEIQLNVYERV